jgi:hypothetical protein
MKKRWKSSFGKSEHFGVMDTSAALLETPVRRLSVSLSKVKGAAFIHEAEDLVVFSPHRNKKLDFSKQA